MTMVWERKEGVIAERFEKNEMFGGLRKEFLTKKDEYVITEKHGEILEEFGPSRFSLKSLPERGFTHIVLVDKGEKTIDETVKKIYLAGNRIMDARFIIKFKVKESDIFLNALLKERDVISLDDIWSKTLSDVVFKKLLPRINQLQLEKIIEMNSQKSLKDWIEKAIRHTFEKWGLAVSFFFIEFIIPEHYVKTIEKAKTEAKDDKTAKPEKKPEESEKIKKLKEELDELKKAKEIAEKKFYKKELSKEAFERMLENFEQKIIEIQTKIEKENN
ncbi:MAG: hypothetical protein J7K72_04250 [Candidatus Aenigmarchaeota archaeon]|nr:hypothetical protein [Candidatus Aenigmarchaeota archaeon]